MKPKTCLSPFSLAAGSGSRPAQSCPTLRPNIPDNSELLPLTDHAEELARAYVQSAVLPAKYIDDARHVAIATTHGIGLIVSWNFKHLANYQRESGFNRINLVYGYPVRGLSVRRNLFMETRTKTFDAVAESRKWKEAVAVETEGMTRDEVVGQL